MQTLAAILVEQNRDLVIDHISLPEKLDIGQVLVEVDKSGICGSQLGEISGVKGPDKWLPHLLGHEGFGRVLEVGPGVSTVSVGDHVVMHWRRGEGLEGTPPKYSWNGQTVNAGFVTTFNRHAIVSENRLTRVTDTLDADLAALMGCAITTGFGVVANDAKLKLGESVVIYGAGGVGLNMIQAAKLASAYPIIAIDLHQNRLDLANDLGATHTIDGNSENVSEQIREILDGQELNVFIDNTGLPQIIAAGFDLISKDGRLVLVGVPRSGNKTEIYTLPIHFGKKILGSEGGATIPQFDIPRYLKLFEKDMVYHKPLVSKRYKLQEINDAIAEMREGAIAGRVMIDMENLDAIG